MIEKLLLKLIQKEKLVANVVSFALGALSTALGLNVDTVYKHLCDNTVVIDQEQSQGAQ